MTACLVREPVPPVVPVAIGGVGGSGTRVVASVVRSLGIYMGADLNGAGDNLWFTLLFRRPQLLSTAIEPDEFERGVRIFRDRMAADKRPSADDARWLRGLIHDRDIDSRWLEQRVKTLCLPSSAAPASRWGWKEPNTHVLLDRLKDVLPGLRYIHVIRNGLDMAYSRNQNQLRTWGAALLGEDTIEISPRSSLKFWCAAHRRVFRTAEEMPGSFLLIDFDRLCSAPHAEFERLVAFLGLDAKAADLDALSASIHPPTSIGRHREHVLDRFDPQDVEYVRALGFDVSR